MRWPDTRMIGQDIAHHKSFTVCDSEGAYMEAPGNLESHVALAVQVEEAKQLRSELLNCYLATTKRFNRNSLQTHNDM